MSVLHAESILNHLATLVCTPASIGVATVNRDYPFSIPASGMPALIITQTEDKPLSEKGPDNLVFQDWSLGVEFMLAVKQSTLPLDSTLNGFRLAVHKAVMADITTGGFTYDIYPGAVSLEYGKDSVAGEQPVAVMKCLFEFIYRTKISDPSF